MKLIQNAFGGWEPIKLRDTIRRNAKNIAIGSILSVIVLLAITNYLAARAIMDAEKARKSLIEQSFLEVTSDMRLVPTGTQLMVEGNVIYAPFDGDPDAPAIYVGDDPQALYKWHEWQLHETKQELDKWKTRAGEPTAILSHVCRQNGVRDESCPVTLYAMAQHESYMGLAMSGDGGRSQGYFHILDIHNLPKSCTHDLECSADFTLKRMLRLGYKTNPDRAVMLHNGTPGTSTTLRYLASVNSKKALWPNE